MHNVRREDLQTKAIKRARTGAVIKISGYCALISGSQSHVNSNGELEKNEEGIKY